ncbi:MAG: hypothetical protein JSU08_06930 [Acidobacteria bacterium]|nr:hypothetical protein [Acidobacteriota bacterium]
MTRHIIGAVLAAGILGIVAAPAAHAQTPASGGLQITEVHSGLVAAPEVRFTSVNGRSATLAGGYGGYEVDRTFFIGAAGYWLTNRDRSFEMQYGGALARWTFFKEQPVSVSAGLLAGFGTATIARTWSDLFGEPSATTLRLPDMRGVRSSTLVRPAISGSTPVRINDDFLLAEPQANVFVKLTPWMRLDVGAGYRFVDASRYMGDQLSGASGSIALRFSGR